MKGREGLAAGWAFPLSRGWIWWRGRRRWPSRWLGLGACMRFRQGLHGIRLCSIVQLEDPAPAFAPHARFQRLRLRLFASARDPLLELLCSATASVALAARHDWPTDNATFTNGRVSTVHKSGERARAGAETGDAHLRGPGALCNVKGWRGCEDLWPGSGCWRSATLRAGGGHLGWPFQKISMYPEADPRC